MIDLQGMKLIDTRPELFVKIKALSWIKNTVEGGNSVLFQPGAQQYVHEYAITSFL